MPVAEPSELLRRLKADNRLPSPPGTALRVLELCRQDDTPVHEVADAIMSDPALSVRLLKYANSSILRVGREVTSVRDAVLLLGLRAVKLTALGFSIATPDFQPRCPGFELRSFWAESFATATLARRFATQLFHADREEAFTAGLLAKIGCLALARGCPKEYSQALEAARGGEPLVAAERRLLGLDHVDFGAQLLADWRLPDVLVDAVQRQIPAEEPTEPAAEESPLASAVRIAVQLASLFVNPEDLRPDQRETARRLVEEELQLDEEGWKSLGEEVLADCQEVSQLFNVELASPTSMLDLYAEAQEEATRVGMVAQLERTRTPDENKDLLRLATTDALTGVANRAKFDDRLGETLAGLRRGHGHCALIMFDVDNFQALNDQYGRDVGDLVLKSVAQSVKGTLREVDLLARYSGEEFVILAPHTDQRGACAVAARARKCVEDLQVDVKGQRLRVTISLGVNVTADYQDDFDAERLVADVAKQLELSKQAGRNTWSYRGRSASRVVRGANAP
jgi:diguanylate cyclase (GGDEF)-like protein